MAVYIHVKILKHLSVPLKKFFLFVQINNCIVHYLLNKIYNNYDSIIFNGIVKQAI